MTSENAADPRRVAYEMSTEAARRQRAGEVEEAAAIYESVVVKFGDSTDSYLQELVAYAIDHRASIRLRRPDIAARTEPTPALIARLDSTEAGPLRVRLARAIASETVVLTMNEQLDEARALSESLVAAVRENDTPDVRVQAAMVAQNVIEFLTAEGRAADAEAALRDVAARFGEELLAEYQESIAEDSDADRDTRLGVRYRRAELLRALGRTDEALEAYTGVISEFADDTEVQPVIDRARERRAALAVGPD